MHWVKLSWHSVKALLVVLFSVLVCLVFQLMVRKRMFLKTHLQIFAETNAEECAFFFPTEILHDTLLLLPVLYSSGKD